LSKSFPRPWVLRIVIASMVVSISLESRWRSIATGYSQPTGPAPWMLDGILQISCRRRRMCCTLRMRSTFGEFELDAEAFQLRRRGEPVHLEPQVLSLLIHLVR